MKRIAVLTSGGDSPGMNAAIRAVVRAAHAYGIDVTGVERGYQGLIDAELSPLGPRSVAGIVGLGGTILRSARCQAFFEPQGRAQAARTLKAHNIEGLIVIGGDGSYRGAAKLSDEHAIPCIGLPGTIDNDIGGTDYTIGYDTALNIAVQAIDRLRDTAHSHDRIFFVEIMGRNSGFLAMMSAIAGGAEEAIVPETPTDIDAIIQHLRDCHARGKTSSILVVAEGDEAGKAIDIAREVAARSEFTDTRVTVLGHIQRGGPPTAFDRILASRLAVEAVEALRRGEKNKIAGLQNGQVVLHPFTHAWESPNRFDDTFIHLAQILAT